MILALNQEMELKFSQKQTAPTKYRVLLVNLDWDASFYRYHNVCVYAFFL